MLKRISVALVFLCFSNLSSADDDSSIFYELLKGAAHEVGKEIVRSYAEKIRRQNETRQPAYQPEPAQEQQADNEGSGNPAIDDKITQTVSEFIYNENNCQIDKLMQFYNEKIYYEQKDYDKEKLRTLKAKACSKKAEINFTNKVKDGKISIENKLASNGSLFKRVTYYVDFSYYSKSQQRTVTGSTGVILVLAGTEPYKIFAERQFDRHQD